MTEYTGRAARISGNLSGEVRIHGARVESRIDNVEDGLITFKTTAVVDAADLLGWLREALPLKDDDLPTAIAILKWAEQQHIRHDGLVERLQALQAALSTTKEGESDE